MSPCGVCAKDIVFEPVADACMTCRYCENVFHAKCVGVSNKTVFNFLITNKNYIWYCDSCITNGEYDTELKKKIEKLEDIIKVHTEQIKNQTKLIDELRKMANQAVTPRSLVSNNRKRTYAEHTEQWSEMCMTPKTVPDSEKTPKRRRFTEVSSIRKRNLNPVLLVKPKSDEDKLAMKSAIKSAVNPKIDPVRYLRDTKSGTIVVACKTYDDVMNIQKKLYNAIGDKYEIDKPAARKPIIKVVGISDFTNKEEIIDCIHTQNDLSRSTCFIEYMKHIQIRRNNSVYYTVFIRTDVSTFDRIM